MDVSREKQNMFEPTELKKKCLDLAVKLVSFSCFSKNICFYFKQILENDTELMSNNFKICCLV